MTGEKSGAACTFCGQPITGESLEQPNQFAYCSSLSGGYPHLVILTEAIAGSAVGYVEGATYPQILLSIACAGQTINTQIIQSSEKAAFKVPNAAIAQNAGKSFIFIRTQDGFKVSPVTVLGKQGEESIISGEFTGNEDIAIKGSVALKAKWLGLGSAE